MSNTNGVRKTFAAATLAALMFTPLQAADQPAFELASVKLHVPGSGGGRDTPGRFVGTFTIGVLIAWAYGLHTDRQLVAPDWTTTLFLDIDAKLPDGASKDQIPRMLQSLLAERLKLAVHQESRLMSVYDLTVAKGGPKMREVDPSKSVHEILQLPQHRGFRGQFTVPVLADLLSTRLDRPVLDFTGLKAVYEMDLQWAPDDPDTLPVTTEPAGLFRAIQDQLGLKLQPRRAPVNVVIVDHVERVPTPN